MKNINAFTTTFFMRDKKELQKFYTRTEFWISFLALVLITLSLIISRYVDGQNVGTSYSLMWRHTYANWALVLGGIVPMIGIVYVFVTTFLFRNNAVLSGINIGIGLLMLACVVMEYVVLKNGFRSGDEILSMSNKPAIGYYCAIIGSIIVVALEFYKLGGQGYYSAEDILNEKTNHDVEIVDGVVMVDGEAVAAANENAIEKELSSEEAQPISNEENNEENVEKNSENAPNENKENNNN